MNNPQWDEIPALALTNIFKYLDFNDRLQASSVSWHWRSVLFQKSFFRNFKFNLHIDNDQKCNFFLQRLIGLTSEVKIIFDMNNGYHYEKIKRLLLIIAKSDHLIGLRFYTKAPSGDYSDEDIDIERGFVEPLKAILARKIPSLKILDLGAIEFLTYYANDFLKASARPQDLQEITFASIKLYSNYYSPLDVNPILLEKCTSLEVLSLDYDTLTDDMLKTLQLLPLKTFMICVHGVKKNLGGVSEAAWAAFSSKFKNIKLILTLVCAFDAVTDLHNILRRNMPLTHLRVLFCNYINVDALDIMSVYYKDTLKSIQWIDSGYEEPDRNVMELYLRSGQDPFVMMSWRCKYLEEIVLHGYVLDPHNLVGISRLRGRNLKKLEVSMLDPPAPNMMLSFIEEISTQLGQKWQPQDSDNIHPALGYMPCFEETRDQYVLNVIKSDLRN